MMDTRDDDGGVGEDSSPSDGEDELQRLGEDSLLEVGRVGRPHGVRGQITLVWHNDDTDLVEHPTPLYLGEDEALPVASVDAVAAGRYVLTITGVASREQAAALTGRAVFVRRKDLPEPEEGWYLADLIGMEVVEESGRLLGKVVGVLPTGGVDVLEIDGELGPWMLPAAEPILLDVDFDSERVLVSPPEGLVPGSESE